MIRATSPPSFGIRVVAIDGGAGAGKSTFARALSSELGFAPIIPTDDFASWDRPLDWVSGFIELAVIKSGKTSWRIRGGTKFPIHSRSLTQTAATSTPIQSVIR
jgi:hypothetical protein